MFLKELLSAMDSAAGQIDSLGRGREILLYNHPDTLRGIFAHKVTKGGSVRFSRLQGLAKSGGTVAAAVYYHVNCYFYSTTEL